MQGKTIRIGTRGSPLALVQSRHVRARLMEAHGLNEGDIELVVIKTSGDIIQDRPLSEVGGKGLFTKEIEEALIDRRVDLAVHSMKDVATELPDGLGIACVLPREDVRDAFISLKYRSLGELPPGARLGTSSLRRQAQVRSMRPDLQVVEFRGNVETRLKKLADGVADATFLACAGLKRLGMEQHITTRIETEVMLPAVAQGAVGIEIRTEDDDIRNLIAPLNCQTTSLCVTAERAFLRKLEGSCRTPIGGLATIDGGHLTLHGQILRPDGSQAHQTIAAGPTASAIGIGVKAAEDLLALADEGFFSQTGPG